MEGKIWSTYKVSFVLVGNIIGLLISHFIYTFQFDILTEQHFCHRRWRFVRFVWQLVSSRLRIILFEYLFAIQWYLRGLFCGFFFRPYVIKDEWTFISFCIYVWLIFYFNLRICWRKWAVCLSLSINSDQNNSYLIPHSSNNTHIYYFYWLHAQFVLWIIIYFKITLWVLVKRKWTYMMSWLYNLQGSALWPTSTYIVKITKKYSQMYHFFCCGL